jgi:hypothetical protein
MILSALGPSGRLQNVQTLMCVVGGATDCSRVTFICVLYTTLRTQISRSICNFFYTLRWITHSKFHDVCNVPFHATTIIQHSMAPVVCSTRASKTLGQIPPQVDKMGIGMNPAEQVRLSLSLSDALVDIRSCNMHPFMHLFIVYATLFTHVHESRRAGTYVRLSQML